MKRGFFGGLLLLCLFFGGLTEVKTARKELSPIACRMEQAAEASLREDYKKAAALAADARAAWEDYHLKYSCLTDQDTVREVDCMYERLEAYLLCRERVHSMGACIVLKNQILGLMEAQTLSLQNLL